MKEIHDLKLGGCSSQPLANYLKALGVFRVVAEQVDFGARCCWQGDDFHLFTGLDEEALQTFFLEQYEPTPVVAPWNGGSGFYYQEEKLKAKDPLTGKRVKTGLRKQPTAATRIVDAVLESSAHRLAPYRKSLRRSKDLVSDMGFEEAPKGKEKEELIQAIRNNLADEAITWLDASVVLTVESAKYPPLLGTGGNDGNTDFSSNFMQRLFELFDPDDGEPSDASKSWLEGSLFATIFDGLVKGVAIGQFSPGAVGGSNAEPGFGSDSLVNPWDFVLMIEGTLLFAAATVKRHQENEHGVLSYPFSVNTSAVGYSSASQQDEKSSRAEIWMPLWDRPVSLGELRALMGEGRSQVGRRRARNGVDFARAIASMGVDRGLEAFQRYGFLERNGKAYFAVPLDRFAVRRQPQVELLNELDSWMIFLGDKAKAEKAPASVRQAFRRLEAAVFSLCKNEGADRVQEVLMSLGGCERALVGSFRWTREAHIRPVPTLSENWLMEADDRSPEFRLAASLASIYGRYTDRDGKQIVMPLRTQMEPVRTWVSKGSLRVAFDELLASEVVWSTGDPVSALNGIMSRRITKAIQSGSKSYPDQATCRADLGDVADFIEGRVDFQKMVALLWGLILVDWPHVSRDAIQRRTPSNSPYPGGSYGLLKLCFSGGKVRDVEEIILNPQIHRRAVNGDGFSAMQLAERRLRGSGLAPALGGIKLSGRSMQRTAAALLFPLDGWQVSSLADKVLRPETKKITIESRV